MKIPGFRLPSYDTLIFDADDLFKIGLRFDYDELDLYETKPEQEILDEYFLLLQQHTKNDTIRAYILRSFIKNKLSIASGNKMVKMEFELREKDKNIDDLLTAISIYYDEYDDEQKGGSFSSTRVIEGFGGGGDR